MLPLARESPRWGQVRIQGGLGKPGVRVGASTIRRLLRSHGLAPAPRRGRPTWSELLRPQARGILATDSHTVETIRLKTPYALFLIELSTRRAHLAGVRAHPDSAWVSQQARSLAIHERLQEPRLLLHDRDSKHPGPLGEVLRTEGARIAHTPPRAPRASSLAERWVRTVRAECLDWTLVDGRRHLERVLRAYVEHYNGARPHRGLDLATPEPAGLALGRDMTAPNAAGHPIDMVRRDVLGGLIHEYEVAA